MLKTILIIAAVIIAIVFVLWYVVNLVDEGEDEGSVLSFIRKVGDKCCLGGRK